VLFGGLQTVALLRHGDELDWGGLPAAVYCLGLATMAAVSLWALWPDR
jgi:hypothetical protein